MTEDMVLTFKTIREFFMFDNSSVVMFIKHRNLMSLLNVQCFPTHTTARRKKVSSAPDLDYFDRHTIVSEVLLAGSQKKTGSRATCSPKISDYHQKNYPI